MTIVFNDKVCENHGLSILSGMVLAVLSKTSNWDFFVDLLLKGEYIYRMEGSPKFELTDKGKELLKNIIDESKSGKGNNEQYFELANRLRDLFPSGKKPGTSASWKANTREIAFKLCKFFSLFGKFSDDDIVDAAKRYIASFNGDTTMMRTLTYFIFKYEDRYDENGCRYRELVSELANFLEDKESTTPDANLFCDLR